MFTHRQQRAAVVESLGVGAGVAVFVLNPALEQSFTLVERQRTLPSATTLVAKSTTTGARSLTGTAAAKGFVPIKRPAPPNGVTRPPGVPPLQKPKPMRFCCAARSTHSPKRPTC